MCVYVCVCVCVCVCLCVCVREEKYRKLRKKVAAYSNLS
jgi:hypothetical protein